MDQQIFESISTLIERQTRIARARIRPDSRLIDFGIDSVGLMDLVIDLEQRFAVEIPDHDLPNLVSLQDVANYIQARVRSQ